MDKRLTELAHMIVHHSVYLKNGENVLIHVSGKEAYPLTEQIIKAVYALGANPFIDIQDQRLLRRLLINFNEAQAKVCAEYEALRMSRMDAFINIKAPDNLQELSDVQTGNQTLYAGSAAAAAAKKGGNVKWTSLKYPTSFMAQMAGMSTEAFENFYYHACLVDYGQMKSDMEPLRELMDHTDKVRILGPGTDLSFSIKGICAAGCAGNYNLPDGEIATAPVRDSVSGRISYNVPSTYNGFTFENVTLTFDKGRIVQATANDTIRLNEILNTDEGARYIGEFALGVNNMITDPINDILFDEKISGSFHFTPGQCYEDPHNGNDSAIHWDLTCIQTLAYGGGEIYFDDILIRKDGLFVPDSLRRLNPPER